VAPEPGNPEETFGGAYYSVLFRQDNRVGQDHNVSPWPTYLSGDPASKQKYRFGWTHPIFFSPANKDELLEAAQVVFSSTDRGATWKVISPDLTRDDKSTEGPSGGPIDHDQTGAETFPDIASLAVSPLNGDEIWAGSADGLVHVTTDHGANWKLVTPAQLPQWAQITSIEPSHTTAGTAYLTASRYMWDDFHPYVYETADYGAHWTQLTNGLPDDQYAFVVRADPREPRLLFAGTRSGVYVSFNAGGEWQPLTHNLPGVQMRDLARTTRARAAAEQCRSASLRAGNGVALACLRTGRRSAAGGRQEPAIRSHGLLQPSGELQRQDARNAIIRRRERSYDTYLYVASQGEAREEDRPRD
jgi:hypothetical protein